MSEDVKLPQTVEEYQKARREAYMQGVKDRERIGLGLNYSGEAKRRYPIKRKVPRRVPLGRECYAAMSERGFVEFYSNHNGGEIPIYRLTKENVPLIADLLANPFDEVDA